MANLNLALKALADPTRRRVYERIAARPRTVVEIADGLPVSRPAVSQHLAKLKAAGLARVTVSGSARLYAIDPAGLSKLRNWLDRFWDEALDAFKAETERPEPGARP